MAWALKGNIRGPTGPAGADAPAALASTRTTAVTQNAVAYVTTGLSVPLAAGKVYTIKAWGHYRTAALTTGIGLRLGGTATATGVRYTTTIWNASTPLQGQAAALATATLSTAVAAANTDYTWEIRGEIRVNAAGTLVVEFASEVAGSVVTIQPDCYLICEPIG